MCAIPAPQPQSSEPRAGDSIGTEPARDRPADIPMWDVSAGTDVVLDLPASRCQRFLCDDGGVDGGRRAADTLEL